MARKNRRVPDDPSKFHPTVLCGFCRSADPEFDKRTMLDKMIVYPGGDIQPHSADHVTDYGATRHQELATQRGIKEGK